MCDSSSSKSSISRKFLEDPGFFLFSVLKIKLNFSIKSEEALSRSEALGLTDLSPATLNMMRERVGCSNLKIVLTTQNIALRID